MNKSLKIDSAAEAAKITLFIKTVLREQGFKNIVIGLSGGIDSAVSLSLLAKSIPSENIYVAHLHYFDSQLDALKSFLKELNVPQKNISNISIKPAVDQISETLNLNNVAMKQSSNRIRLGNIMARTRMIFLYDLAKKHNALACGTENKSELLLGYFTRFGDEASDLEPIRHLYKTQVYQLAKCLDVPKKIIDLTPTAGLWNGQTDEKDFGFSYKEADCVLDLYFDKKKPLSDIIKDFPNAEKIIGRVNKNSFKRHLPYTAK